MFIQLILDPTKHSSSNLLIGILQIWQSFYVKDNVYIWTHDDMCVKCRSDDDCITYDTSVVLNRCWPYVIQLNATVLD